MAPHYTPISMMGLWPALGLFGFFYLMSMDWSAPKPTPSAVVP